MDCSMTGFPVPHYLPLCTNSCWLNQWCYLTISSSAPPFSSAFNLSQHEDLFQWVGSSVGQSSRASASALVLPMNIQSWFPLGLTGLISLLSKGLSRVFSSTSVMKHQFFSAQPSLWSNSHLYMITGKTIALTIRIIVGKVMCLLFNMLSRFVITFLPRSKRLNFMAAVTICSDFGAQENSLSLLPFSPHLFAQLMGPDAVILVLICSHNFTKFTY